MKLSILSLSLGLAALLVLAPASAIAHAAADAGTGAEQVAGERGERSPRLSFEASIGERSALWAWARAELIGQAPVAKRLSLKIEFADGYAPEDPWSAFARPVVASAKTGLDIFNPPEPIGNGRALGQRDSVMAHCQPHASVDGSLHTADIEYQWEWRKPLDDQGREIEDAAPEWTLVGITVKELMPAVSSVC